MPDVILLDGQYQVVTPGEAAEIHGIAEEDI